MDAGSCTSLVEEPVAADDGTFALAPAMGGRDADTSGTIGPRDVPG